MNTFVLGASNAFRRREWHEHEHVSKNDRLRSQKIYFSKEKPKIDHTNIDLTLRIPSRGDKSAVFCSLIFSIDVKIRPGFTSKVDINQLPKTCHFASGLTLRVVAPLQHVLKPILFQQNAPKSQQIRVTFFWTNMYTINPVRVWPFLHLGGIFGVDFWYYKTRGK